MTPLSILISRISPRTLQRCSFSSFSSLLDHTPSYPGSCHGPHQALINTTSPFFKGLTRIHQEPVSSTNQGSSISEPYKMSGRSGRDYDHRSERPERQNEYWLPGEGISREVIQADICRYLGNDALVRPAQLQVCNSIRSTSGHNLEAKTSHQDSKLTSSLCRAKEVISSGLTAT